MAVLAYVFFQWDMRVINMFSCSIYILQTVDHVVFIRLNTWDKIYYTSWRRPSQSAAFCTFILQFVHVIIVCYNS